MRLKGKKAIVTGANRSIGKAIAVSFAKEGADVVISYRSDKEGAMKTKDLILAYGVKGEAIFADFSNLSEIDSFFNEALSFLGGVDLLVNNAGAYDTSSLLDVDLKTFEHLYRIGVTAPLRLTQLSAKHMIDQKVQGKIINISSISGSNPHPGRIAHGSAKAGLQMLTKNCALELAEHGICVNAIAAGSTPYSEDELIKSDRIPLGREGLAKDQADMAVFLACKESNWITGQIFTVDGGDSL